MCGPAFAYIAKPECPTRIVKPEITYIVETSKRSEGNKKKTRNIDVMALGETYGVVVIFAFVHNFQCLAVSL